MKNEKLKNLLYVNCSKYVGGYDCLPASELEHIKETVIELICEMRGAPVAARYKGEIDIHQNFKKINNAIPNIAKYANKQNKVSDADFFSNHAFHILPIISVIVLTVRSTLISFLW